MAETSVTLTFVTQTEQAGQTLIMQLDDDAIKAFYGLAEGESKGTWLFGDSVFISVYKYPNDLQYEIKTSAGTLTPNGNGIKAVTEEQISFVEKTEGNLALPLYSDFKRHFYGMFNGTITASGQSVVMSKSAFGVLECKYNAKFDRYKLTLDNPDSFVTMINDGWVAPAVSFPVIVLAKTIEE